MDARLMFQIDTVVRMGGEIGRSMLGGYYGLLVKQVAMVMKYDINFQVNMIIYGLGI